ncbi:ABC transporter ATP-binding protein [Actinokineospora soli]|uniref:ABC transporter ATP-binding protein n=1 Tax=Actinokineospora soli TaxID=1048753 RepID=A0ABW2TTP5_9PSEU
MADVAFDLATRHHPGAATPAVDALDLAVADGEFLVLVGPAGAGKSTALRMLAGLEPVDRGAVRVAGRDITALPARERDVAVVVEGYALHDPGAIRGPSALLVDELSTWDTALRDCLRHRPSVTTIYATRDPAEATAMGDRVAVLRDGVLQQCGTPRALHDRPATAFVAGFVGAMNLPTLPVVDGGARLGTTVIPLPRRVLAAIDTPLVTLGLRPDALRLTRAGHGSIGVVTLVEETGYGHCTLPGSTDVVIRLDPRAAPAVNEVVHVVVDPADCHFFAADTGVRLTA